MTLPDTSQHIWSAIQDCGDAPFWIAQSGTQSYIDFARRVAAFGACFDTQQISTGAVIVICLENDFDAAASFVAGLLTGRVPTIVSSNAGEHRLRAICLEVEAAGIVTDGPRAGADWGCPILSLPKRPSNLGRMFGSARKDQDLAPVNTEKNSLAYLLFTSGTTSDPKGVMITWENLMSHLETLARVLKVDGSSRLCNPTPISHTDGLVMGALLAAVTGAAVIRPGPFEVGDIENWLLGISKNRPTHIITNPTTIQLIERYAARDDYFPQALAVSSASHLRQELWEKVEARFGIEVVNLYGLTETVTSALYSGRLPEMGPIATLGFPIDCEARLGDENGAPLDPVTGARGEIQLRGPHITVGYWRSPERNAETFTADGWMRTGDLACLNGQGAFEFIGRSKSAINCGGTLIQGTEIDECLLRHPKVVESVTVGLPHPVFEEIPVAAIVTSEPVDETEIISHARNGLEDLRVPKHVLNLTEIPRGESGKPRLEELRQILLQRLEKVSPDSGDLLQKVTKVAADVFGVSEDALDIHSGPGTVKGWDSFSHLNLVLAIEQHFGIRLPTRLVASIRTIGDLHRAVDEQLV